MSLSAIESFWCLGGVDIKFFRSAPVVAGRVRSFPVSKGHPGSSQATSTSHNHNLYQDPVDMLFRLPSDNVFVHGCVTLSSVLFCVLFIRNVFSVEFRMCPDSCSLVFSSF